MALCMHSVRSGGMGLARVVRFKADKVCLLLSHVLTGHGILTEGPDTWRLSRCHVRLCMLAPVKGTAVWKLSICKNLPGPQPTRSSIARSRWYNLVELADSAWMHADFTTCRALQPPISSYKLQASPHHLCITGCTLSLQRSAMVNI